MFNDLLSIPFSPFLRREIYLVMPTCSASFRIKFLRKSTLVLLAVTASAAAGCGLKDYQNQVGNEQKRVAYFDEENKLLGDPVTFPQHLDTKPDVAPPQPLRVFLRLPREFSSTGKETVPGLVYIFESKTASAPATTGPAANPQPGPGGNTQAAYLAVSTELKRDDFMKQVAPVFGAPDLGKLQRVQLTRPDLATPISFDTMAVTMPPITYFINFYQESNYQVAVVFQVTASGGPAVLTDAMKYSLRSLAVGK